MFVSPGSVLQLVVALLFSLGFGFASAWYQPYASDAANMFKVGTEITLLMTLTLAILLRFDLSDEDVSVDFVGTLMLFSTTSVPSATLTVGIHVAHPQSHANDNLVIAVETSNFAHI